MYRYPVVLNTNYMKNFLNIGNATNTNIAIQVATDKMLSSLNQP